MPASKIHLDRAADDAVGRFAKKLNARPEAVTSSALNRLMLDARDLRLKADVVQTAASRRDNLPLWSNSAGGPHGYEGQASAEPEPSRYL